MDPASWKQAKEVIFDALELPSAEREGFVRQRCADPAVCAEVLAMIKDCSTSEDFLASLPRDLDLEEADELADLRPGTHISQYVIVDRLGRGGMGQVFLASDQELRRKVALKCLLSSRPDSETERARILREARAAAAINHANVATVYHVIEHGDRAFIVMEYVEGESLAARLKRERLPVDRVVAIGCQLAAALTAAHTRGVIHRDLKPANVQITHDGSVKVLDFGVARLARSLTSPSSGASTKGPSAVPVPAFVGGGTVPYMSPEQLFGRPVDERSDIYSLGVVLFEMSTGRRPYATNDPLELIEAQAKGAPRADAVDARVPVALADVIAKTLEPDASRRHESASEVKSALERIERQLQTPVSDQGELIRRRVTRVAVGVPIVILTLGVVGFITTTGFNVTFGRTGPFAAEPWTSYFGWGLTAVRPSVVDMIVLAVLVATVRFVLRLLELIGPIGRATTRVRTRARTIALAVGLDDPVVLAQGLAGLGLVAVFGMWWLHYDLFFAWANMIDRAALKNLAPLSPTNKAEFGQYRIQLDVLMLAFGFGLIRVLQLHRRYGTSAGTSGVWMLGAILAVLLILSEAPYRTLYHAEGERVDYDGARCYIIGKSDDEFLIFCPASAPPRNRKIKQDDPTLHRLGGFESVFTEIARSQSSR